jgi:adenosylmethionine-8-amino-7-oxononanoate aminotransferase
MSDLIVVGTDTDAGKTTFALLWLTAFGKEYAYWKPVETGPSDSELVRRLLSDAKIFEPIARFEEPVAPSLAARRAGRTIESAATIANGRPNTESALLIETFGGPLSPLNDAELQVELIRRLGSPCVLVTNSAIGAIGRALTSLRVLRDEDIRVAGVVLLGRKDEFAETEICKHGDIPVAGIELPAKWERADILEAATRDRPLLNTIRGWLDAVTVSQSSPGLLERDARHIWHPYTALRGAEPPLPVVAARDEFLELADGRRLIDGISSWWTILHGHRHPRLMAALRRASERIDHVLFAGLTHPFAVECAAELMKTAPWPDGRVFFSDNGSTTVEVALKMAYQFWCHRGEPQRTLFVGFENGYHGDTFGAMAVGRDPLFFGRFEPLLFRAVQVPVCAQRLDDVLKRRGPETAAVMIEPLVQGAGGMRMHSAETLRDLHAVARRHGVMFIVDEVMTAGRTGSYWAHSRAGIVPDLICAAKTLAGGVLPLAATLASPQIVAAFDVDDRAKTFFHGHSFTAHPLACAVAAENLRMMANGNWLRESERINRRWQRAAASLLGEPGVADVRVCGTILAMDVGAETGYLAATAAQMRKACTDEGVLLRPLGNVLYALPPLNTSDESLERIVEAMRKAVRATRG